MREVREAHGKNAWVQEDILALIGSASDTNPVIKVMRKVLLFLAIDWVTPKLTDRLYVLLAFAEPNFACFQYFRLPPLEVAVDTQIDLMSKSHNLALRPLLLLLASHSSGICFKCLSPGVSGLKLKQASVV